MPPRTSAIRKKRQRTIRQFGAGASSTFPRPVNQPLATCRFLLVWPRTFVQLLLSLFPLRKTLRRKRLSPLLQWPRFFQTCTLWMCTGCHGTITCIHIIGPTLWASTTASRNLQRSFTPENREKTWSLPLAATTSTTTLTQARQRPQRRHILNPRGRSCLRSKSQSLR
jgi:hypothetical protein